MTLGLAVTGVTGVRVMTGCFFASGFGFVTGVFETGAGGGGATVGCTGGGGVAAGGTGVPSGEPQSNGTSNSVRLGPYLAFFPFALMAANRLAPNFLRPIAAARAAGFVTPGPKLFVRAVKPIVTLALGRVRILFNPLFFAFATSTFPSSTREVSKRA